MRTAINTRLVFEIPAKRRPGKQERRGVWLRPESLPPCAAVGSHRWLTTVSGLPAIVLSAQQLRQRGDVGGDAPGLVAGEEARRRAPAGLLLRGSVGAQKRRGFPKNPRRVLAWCRRCFWGSPLACDPSQRKCAPATVDESLLARTIQANDDAGWVARVVWGGVGWGFQR